MADIKQEILLGNEAIARGLIESGCHIITSYPGTPSSEIVPELARLKDVHKLDMYIEWSANEKVAYDIALGASYMGKRAATVMKQVGLNVAADSLMSSAYTGVKGGLVIISCDDPGPHSSQTEQDSRYFAMFAKVPVIDPSSPQEAKDLLPFAFELSEKFEIPVIFRPAIRICHAKQNVTLKKIAANPKPAKFDKNPERWAATPRYRLILHRELNRKLELIREEFEKQKDKNYTAPGSKRARLGIITGGVSFAIVQDILSEYKLSDKIKVLKITTPYPLPVKLTGRFISQCQKVLILEETDEVIEMQARTTTDRKKILGRLDGTVPREGELTPEVIYDIIRKTIKKSGITPSLPNVSGKLTELVNGLKLPIRRPTLCPGCPHRASFYSIKKALPDAIFPSDIGCYTLGINLGAVDTCLAMGCGITLANGFYQALRHDNQSKPVVGTIGDSTFYHAGIPALINAVYTGARFVLVILDNSITAMTGMQPTPDTGILADGIKGRRVPLPELIRGCGIQPEGIRECDPYDINTFGRLVKEAYDYTLRPDGGMAVIIAKHPCPLYYREEHKKNQVKVKILKELCNGCRHCIRAFECPALVYDETSKTVDINYMQCSDCGVCIQVCRQKAIQKITD